MRSACWSSAAARGGLAAPQHLCSSQGWQGAAKHRVCLGPGLVLGSYSTVLVTGTKELHGDGQRMRGFHHHQWETLYRVRSSGPHRIPGHPGSAGEGKAWNVGTVSLHGVWKLFSSPVWCSIDSSERLRPLNTEGLCSWGAAAVKGVRGVDLVCMKNAISIPKFAGNFLREQGEQKTSHCLQNNVLEVFILITQAILCFMISFEGENNLNPTHTATCPASCTTSAKQDHKHFFIQ